MNLRFSAQHVFAWGRERARRPITPLTVTALVGTLVFTVLVVLSGLGIEGTGTLLFNGAFAAAFLILTLGFRATD